MCGHYSLELCKGPLTQAIFVAQLNAIVIALKLQLQNHTCKPAAISLRFYAIYRHGLSYNLRNVGDFQ